MKKMVAMSPRMLVVMKWIPLGNRWRGITWREAPIMAVRTIKDWLSYAIGEDMGGDMNGEGGMAVEGEGMDGGHMGGDSPGGEGQMMNEEEFKQH